MDLAIEIMIGVSKLGEMGVVNLQLVKDIDGLRKLITQIIGRMANDRPSTPRIGNGRGQKR